MSQEACSELPVSEKKMLKNNQVLLGEIKYALLDIKTMVLG
jgi:hypothetical protein